VTLTEDQKALPVLTVIKEMLDATDQSPAVRQSVKRHYEHLESLAASLRKLGMDGREVDENIMLVFREYERELANYISTV
jgi:hypothetical protein